MEAVAQRATCDRGRSGSVIVRDKRIVSTGYVGAPAGAKHCDEVGHEFISSTNTDGVESQHCVRTTHAEQNAIVHAARFGSSLNGATLYCKMTPCYACAKMIVNAGIVRIVAKNDYHAGGRSKELFKEVGIQYELVDDKVVKYGKQ